MGVNHQLNKFRNNKMNQTNEPEMCKKCEAFFGRPDQDNMCSKCFKESTPKVSTESQNKVDSFKLQTLLPQIVEHKKTELAEKIETKVEEIIPEKKEAPKNRCYKCDRKTGIRGFTCKCSFNFCTKCRLPEEHDCEFDHANIEKERLKNRLVKVEASKF